MYYLSDARQSMLYCDSLSLVPSSAESELTVKRGNPGNARVGVTIRHRQKLNLLEEE